MKKFYTKRGHDGFALSEDVVLGGHGLVDPGMLGVYGGGGGGTTVQKTEPWKGQQPYLRDVYSEAQKLFDAGPNVYYPGQTIADQSDWTKKALDDLANYYTNPGNKQAQAALSGSVAYMSGLSDPSKNPLLGMGMALGPEAAGQLFGNITGTSGASQRLQELSAVGGGGAQPGLITSLGGLSIGSGPNLSLGSQGSYFADLPEGVDVSNMTLPQLEYFTKAIAQQEMQTTPGLNQYTQALIDSIISNTNTNFNESVIPGLELNILGNNAYGSTRQGIAEGLAAGKLADSQVSNISKLLYDQYNQDMARRLQAGAAADTAALQGRGQDADLASQAANILATVRGQDVNYNLGAGQSYLDAVLKKMGLETDIFGTKTNAAVAARGQDASLASSANSAAASMYSADQGRMADMAKTWANLSSGSIGQVIGALQSGQSTALAGAQGAASFSPTLQSMGMLDINNLAKAGQSADAYQQQLINEMIKKWNFEQTADDEALSRYVAAIAGIPHNGGTTTTTGAGTSPVAGALGGALGGLTTAGMLGMGPLAAGGAAAMGPAGWALLAGSALLGSGIL